MNSRELTAQIKSDTADILRLLDQRLAELAVEYDGHEPLTEARRHLSRAIMTAETTSNVTWAEGLNGKIIRIEKVSDGPIE